VPVGKLHIPAPSIFFQSTTPLLQLKCTIGPTFVDTALAYNIYEFNITKSGTLTNKIE